MRSRLKIFLPITVLLVGVGIAFLLIKNRKVIQPAPIEVLLPLVRVSEANLTNLQFKVRSQGTVMPRSEINLAPEVSGRVVSIPPSMAAGGFFNEGDVLLRIESRDFELAVVRAKAQVSEAEARLAREDAEAEIARKEWEVLGVGATPSPLVLREPQLAEARAVLASAHASLELAERDLEKTKVRAPFSGRVWEKRADVGQFVNRGTTIARIYSVDFAEVRLPVPANELAFVDVPIHYRGESAPHDGPKVILRGQFAGNTYAWTGQIVRTEGEIDSRSRMMTLVARVPDPYGRAVHTNQPPLSVGMYVEAEIFGREESNIFHLPRSALLPDGNILIVDGDDKLHFRKVGFIRADHESVVLGSGLQPGERVCLSTLDTPVDGMKVRTILDREPRAQKVSMKGNP